MIQTTIQQQQKKIETYKYHRMESRHEYKELNRNKKSVKVSFALKPNEELKQNI